MRTIVFRNTFHNSIVRVRVAEDDFRPDPHGWPAVRLSPSQIRRVERELCGIRDCCCGNHQNFQRPLDDSGVCYGGTDETPTRDYVVFRNPFSFEGSAAVTRHDVHFTTRQPCLPWPAETPARIFPTKPSKEMRDAKPQQPCLPRAD